MFQRTKICTGLLIAIGSGSFAMTGSAFAQDNGGVQRVEIIGSSIKRVDTESDAPITTISREEIAKTGATSVEELMRSVTASQSSGSTAAASASGATTGGISTVSLRGLGPSRTLVLVNGLRSAPYGSPSDSVAVDIDSIPVAAIERIEILKEGAGAIYGSDAVAGVINFVLRKNFAGTEVNGYAGTSYDGKASVFKGSLIQGFDLGGKGNATLLITGEHDSPLYGKDRSFANTAIFPKHDQNTASSNSFPGNISVPGVPGTYNPLLPVDPVTHRGLASDTAADCGPNSTYIPQFSLAANNGPGAKCLFDPAPFVSLSPDIKKIGALFNGSYNISDNMTLHGDASISNKKQFTSIQASPINATFGIPFHVTTDSPYYPTAFITGLTGGATPTLSVAYRPFITGGRALTDSSTNERFAIGLDGNVGGWDYTGNLLYSASQVNESLVSGYFRIDNDATGPGIVPLLNGQVKDASGNTLWVNPFGNSSDAVTTAAHATNFTGTAFNTSTSLEDAQFKISRDDLFKLPGGGVGVALGAEARRDGYKLASASALASGNISGYGGSFSPIDKTRNVYSLFGELDVPVIKDLNIDAAVRYDRYGSSTNPNSIANSTDTLNTIGTVDANGNDLALPASAITNFANQSIANAGSFGHTTGKIGAKWELNKQFVFRGTYSTGFRAPSLLELYGPLASGVTAVFNDPKRCNAVGGAADCAAQFNEITGGNGNLKPERSATWTLGTVLEPIKDVSFALDYFHTKLKDEISTLDPTYMLQHEDLYGAQIIRDTAHADGVGSAGEIIAVDQREQNIGEAVIAGIDFDLHGTTKLSSGTYGLGVGGTWQTKWDTVNPDGTRQSAIGQTSSAAAGFTPRVKLTTEGSYRTPDGKLEFTGIYNWQSGATDVCGNLDQDDFGNCAAGISAPKVKSYGTASFQVKWDPTKTFTGAVGVKDAFQAKVPYANGTGSAFQGGYDPTYVDPHGRFWYTSATVRF